MYQTNSLTIQDKIITLYDIDEEKAKKLQDFLDSISVAAGILGYRITVESESHTSYDIITFEKEDNAVAICFQRANQKTTCYGLHNGHHVSINKIKNLI